MRTHRHEVAGEPVTIHVVETEDDLEGFRDFIRGHLSFLGLDSETTGLDIYDDAFELRLVQFGTPSEAWVVPAERGPVFREDIRKALRAVSGFVLHNASFDLQVFDRVLGVPMEELWPKVTDTKILTHLIDPRAVKEGGTGHKLEELTKHYIDADVAENVKTLMTKLAVEYHTTKDRIWRKVDLFDPKYNLYAGMDPILAARLMQKAIPLIPRESENLISFEHELSEVCAYVERTGILLDPEYSKKFSGELRYEESVNNEIALGFGCEKVNSTEQVADVLEALGVKIKGRTPQGKRQVNDDLLTEVADSESPAAEFARSVIEAKRAGSWRKTWVQKFVDMADSEDRCHPNINPLQARTARMSISGIPAQNIPADNWTVRRCFLADENHRIASIDYQTQELRVLAALSNDQTMIQAFKGDADLHQMTGDAAGVDRKVGKMANFLNVYGGGPGKLAKDAGITFPVAKRVLDAFNETYPGVTRLSHKLQREASADGYVTTPVGRRLPVDPTRAYSSLNYVVQSTSRDVTARAMIRLHKAGFTPYIRIPIHDEVLCSLPADKADWGAQEIGRVMVEQMGDVRIGTDPEVGGRSWGSLYGATT